MMWKPIILFAFAFGFTSAIAAIWFLPPSTNADATMAESPIKRWAILSDSNARATGLVDLVFADLATSRLELVERDELEKVADAETTSRFRWFALASEFSKRIGLESSTSRFLKT